MQFQFNLLLVDENEEITLKNDTGSLMVPQATYALPYDLTNFKIPGLFFMALSSLV